MGKQGDEKQVPFFFIIGRPRSGTYLLRSLLEAHPNVNIPSECPLILNLYPKYSKVTNWSSEQIEALYEDLLRHKELKNWHLDWDQLKTDWLKMEGDYSYTDFISSLYLHHQSAFEKQEIKLLGDKNPVYSTFIDKVFPIFPKAKFLQLSRDYRDQLVSLGNVDFESGIPALTTYRWKQANTKLVELKKQFPERFLTVRYEDLVNQPEFYLKKICAFLEIEYTSIMLERFNSKKDVLTDFQSKEVEKYHKSLQQPLSTSKVGVWKKELAESKVKMADCVAGDLSETFGYKRKYTNHSFIIKIKAAPMITYGKMYEQFRLLIHHLPFRMYIRIHYGLQVLAPIYSFIKSKLGI